MAKTNAVAGEDDNNMNFKFDKLKQTRIKEKIL